MATEQTTSSDLEQQLKEMLEIETFDPPEEFRERALIQDDSIYEEAERNPTGWWATQADIERELEELLDRETFEPPDEFRQDALWNDPAVYERASADPHCPAPVSVVSLRMPACAFS